ncbi:hypothetical protein FB451DRAFT_1162810 [Mycena latifolia]|nr:hypothetical protein FB451DRAFT_1162810 [Mycena latifolia]
MKLLAVSAIFASIAMCTSTPARNFVHDDPYASITGSLTGEPHPTSTASAVVNAYGQAVQMCGPNIDAALKQLLPMYGPAIGFDASNITVTDQGFLSWAHEQPTFNTADLQCQDTENALFNAVNENSETNSSASPTTISGSGLAGSAPPLTTPPVSVTESSKGAGSSAPSATSPLPGGAINHASQPLVVMVGLVWVLVGLN